MWRSRATKSDVARRQIWKAIWHCFIDHKKSSIDVRAIIATWIKWKLEFVFKQR